MINKGKVIERLENRQGPDVRRAWSSEEAPTPSLSHSGKHWSAVSQLSSWQQDGGKSTLGVGLEVEL